MTEQDRLFWLEVRRAALMFGAAVSKDSTTHMRRAALMLASSIDRRFPPKAEPLAFVPPHKKRDAA